MTWTVTWDHEDAFADAPPVECEQTFETRREALAEFEEQTEDMFSSSVVLWNDETGASTSWPWDED